MVSFVHIGGVRQMTLQFKEDLRKAILTARAEKNQEEQGRRNLEANWETYRRNTLLPIFKVAAELLSETVSRSQAGFDNGAIYLVVGWRERDADYTLKFNLDK